MANSHQNKNNNKSTTNNNKKSCTKNDKATSTGNTLDNNRAFGLLYGGCSAANKSSNTALHKNNTASTNNSRCYHVTYCEQQPLLMGNNSKRTAQIRIRKTSHMMIMTATIIITMIALMASCRCVQAAPSTTEKVLLTTALSRGRAAEAPPATSLAKTTTTTATAIVIKSGRKTALHRTANSIRSSTGSKSNITIVPQHSSRSTTRLHKRHSKRHSNWYDYVNYNENSTILEWANPCGGFYDPTQVGGADFGGMKRKRNKEVFNILKRSAGNEFKTLNGSQQEIDISNIQLWSLYEYTYKFLPKLKMNSSIALRRWYRNTQTYVASFAYLRRIQLKWDHTKRQRESRVAYELKHLLLSSRSMLCELETAINSTQPRRRRAQQHQQQPSLYIFSRQQMNKRLKLRTKRSSERNPDVLHEADVIDLQYVKLYYYEFLETMWKVLRKNMKRRGQIALRENRKEFNEVAKKSFGSLAASSSSGEKQQRQRLRNRDKTGRRGTKRQEKKRQRRQRRRQQRALRRPRVESSLPSIHDPRLNVVKSSS